ncbi:hypothetical protein PUNSTDRAFT_117745 [Punctularia strigosozonata HHB-11173 SS5]|uniref:uncharacterized protein n=1 Tax=Punctularia strigosozonata (strain HHB-11173) TaxID=741275 RepID=UPI0004416309|nr:uncharacterized protein PUNSTDRAFT_117745 [Punctularia strigosozonata HHB-11173 SS5]EIN14174.1 hypothetical protein PUNSTDRAFT_117745 [Punctularia strigosozonata HHB-11173 SS5]
MGRRARRHGLVDEPVSAVRLGRRARACAARRHIHATRLHHGPDGYLCEPVHPHARAQQAQDAAGAARCRGCRARGAVAALRDQRLHAADAALARGHEQCQFDAEREAPAAQGPEPRAQARVSPRPVVRKNPTSRRRSRPRTYRRRHRPPIRSTSRFPSRRPS